jgi:hypothetical protein
LAISIWRDAIIDSSLHVFIGQHAWTDERILSEIQSSSAAGTSSHHKTDVFYKQNYSNFFLQSRQTNTEKMFRETRETARNHSEVFEIIFMFLFSEEN